MIVEEYQKTELWTKAVELTASAHELCGNFHDATFSSKLENLIFTISTQVAEFVNDYYIDATPRSHILSDIRNAHRLRDVKRNIAIFVTLLSVCEKTGKIETNELNSVLEPAKVLDKIIFDLILKAESTGTIEIV